MPRHAKDDVRSSGPARRLTTVQLSDLIRRYNAREPMKALSRRFGYDGTTLRAAIRHFGGCVRPKRALSLDQITDLVRRYDAREPMKSLSRAFGCDESTLRHAIRHGGGTIRPARRRGSVTIDLDRVKELSGMGISSRRIAKDLCVSHQCILYHIRHMHYSGAVGNVLKGQNAS